MAERDVKCSSCDKLLVKIEHGRLVVDMNGLVASFDRSGLAVFNCGECRRETAVSFRSEIRERQTIA
jgi:ribosomal protein S27E